MRSNSPPTPEHQQTPVQGRVQPPARTRQAELQAFAAQLMQDSALPFTILWSEPPYAACHLLCVIAPDGQQHFMVGTEEDIAHWLHVRAMQWRAARRQRDKRIHQKELLGNCTDETASVSD